MTIPVRPVLILLLLAAPLAALGANAADPGVDPLAGYPPGSVLLEDGDVAVPLSMPTPADYTPEIHEKVLAASAKGLAYDAANDREVMLATNFLFIRPGAMMWSPAICTMNFIWGSTGSYQIGTAGHCTPANRDVVLLVGYPSVFVSIGKTAISHNNGIGDDWALVNIKAAFQPYVDANVADIMGPQGGAYSGVAYVGLVGKHIGHGLGIGTGGTPRAGQIMFARDTAWGCVCVVDWGDSGSPILAVSQTYPLGQALGVITHLSVGTSTAYGTLATAVPATVVNGDGNPLPPA